MIASSENRPIITIGMITYNQAAYIEEAFEALLAQSYSPLEIVVCDDASPDSTFEVLSRIAAQYRGSHVIKLHRNDNNLGVGGNVNAVFERSTGALVVLAGGDDVSHPLRVEKLVSMWMKTGRPSAVFSDVRSVDSGGQPLGSSLPFYMRQERLFEGRELLTHSCLTVLAEQGKYLVLPGCAAAWRPELFSRFGPLADGICLEDLVLSVRAALTDGVAIVRESLLDYRQLESSVSSTDGGRGMPGWRCIDQKLRMRHRVALNYLHVSESMRKDVALALGERHIAPEVAQIWNDLVNNEIQKFETEVSWWSMSLWRKLGNLDCAPLKTTGGKFFSLLPHWAVRLIARLEQLASKQI